MSFENNGMITKIWGPSLWIALHTITFGYPIKPTEQEKADYKQFFYSLKNVLPCIYCRQSYEKFITEGSTVLTDKVLESRETLTRWLFDIHNRVNDKLGVTYGDTFEEVKAKYESYRASCHGDDHGCTISLDERNRGYKEIKRTNCPIIDTSIAKKFTDLAIQRGIKPKYFFYLNYLNRHNGQIDRKDRIWDIRNKVAKHFISIMREKEIPSIEPSGKYKGLPTIMELKLILCLSSNLPKSELEEIANKL